MPSETHHHFAEVLGRRVFYREAGDPDAPSVVLLHGAPASSFMFRNLIPQLADTYHVIAPDDPGFGLSDAPTIDEFDYTFDALTDSVEALLGQVGVTTYAIYVQDYGAPVGWRLALRNPQAVTAVITQNGNLYVDGFVPSFWDPIWAYSVHPTPETEAPIRAGLTLESIRWQYTHGVPDPTLVSPDTWHHDHAALQRPGNLEAQLTLLRRYRTNVALYPAVQEWIRTSAVPLLAVWGRNDEIFDSAGATAFLRDARTPGSNCSTAVTSCSSRILTQSRPSSTNSFAQLWRTTMSELMDAAVLHTYGQPLEVRRIPIPLVRPGHVVVRVEASGVNPLDTKTRGGLAAHARTEPPAVLGIDLAGIVDAVAEDVSTFKPGDLVYGMTGGVGGSWFARRVRGRRCAPDRAVPLPGPPVRQQQFRWRRSARGKAWSTAPTSAPDSVY